MVALLEKTRKVNKLLQRSENVEYDGISRVLSNVIDANVYITDKKGDIRGYAFASGIEDEVMLDEVISKGKFPKDYVARINKYEETQANISTADGKNSTIVPIYGVGRRIGALIIERYDESFEDEDLILAEYGATVVGMELIREHTEKLEEIARKKANVQIALATLSFSEAEAAVNILGELNGSEGLLVASKIADRVGITRSVIVNALRKFESAGVIESKSLGMKGTYIKILNEYLLEEVQKLRR